MVNTVLAMVRYTYLAELEADGDRKSAMADQPLEEPGGATTELGKPIH
jgi:hypothetical protein